MTTASQQGYPRTGRCYLGTYHAALPCCAPSLCSIGPRRASSFCLPLACINDGCRMLSWSAYRVEEAGGDACRPSTWPPDSLLTDGGRRDYDEEGTNARPVKL